jgi:hypothetical protein
MGNAAFLLVAVGVSVVGSLWLWWSHRRPRRSMSSVEEFQREMDALGRKPAPSSRPRRRATPQAPGTTPPPDAPKPERR